MKARWTAICLIVLAHATPSLTSTPKSPRIAIVGAGIGGASATSFLTKLFKENGFNVTIDVYEKRHVGGRLATSELNGHLYETGGSAIHPKNKYMQQFVKDLGLSKRHVFGVRLGLYDGKEYIVMESGRTLSSFGKAFHRYGNSISSWHQIINEILKRFLRVYDIQDAGYAFSSVVKLLEAVDPMLVNLTKTSTREFLLGKGVLPLFVNEIVAGIIRVAYGQTPDINALVGTLSMAGAKAGLWGVRGGNEQVPQMLIKKCDATLIHRKVTKIALKQDGTFRVDSEAAVGPSASATVPSIRNLALTHQERYLNGTHQRQESYDMVIVATPLAKELSGISFEGFPSKNQLADSDCYHQSVTTLVNGKLNTEYLQAAKKESLLGEIMTTTDNAMFNSLSRVYPVDLDEELNQLASVWKVSSRFPLTDDQMDTVFVERRDSTATQWFAYPHYTCDRDDVGGATSTFSAKPFVLHPGMFQTSSIDWAATSIEMSAISGRNAALLALAHWTKKSDVVDSFRGIYVKDEL